MNMHGPMELAVSSPLSRITWLHGLAFVTLTPWPCLHDLDSMALPSWPWLHGLAFMTMTPWPCLLTKTASMLHSIMASHNTWLWTTLYNIGNGALQYCLQFTLYTSRVVIDLLDPRKVCYFVVKSTPSHLNNCMRSCRPDNDTPMIPLSSWYTHLILSSPSQHNGFFSSSHKIQSSSLTWQMKKEMRTVFLEGLGFRARGKRTLSLSFPSWAGLLPFSFINLLSMEQRGTRPGEYK